MSSRLPLAGCRESRESLSTWDREARGRTSAVTWYFPHSSQHTAGLPRSSVRTHLLKYPRVLDVAGRLTGAFACLMSSRVVLVQGTHLETFLASLKGCRSRSGHA